jgi:hypothetical protein
MQRAYVSRTMSLKDTTPQPGLRHLDVTHYVYTSAIKFNKSSAQALSCRIPEHVFLQTGTLSGPTEESSGVCRALSASATYLCSIQSQ